MKTLVLYYTNSYKTASVARIIRESIGGDIEQILVEEPYGESLMGRSKEELDSRIFPKIKKLTHDPLEYDAIVLGTPTWWIAPSTPVLSLIQSGVLKGKKVYPFITTGFDVHGVEKKIDEALVGSNIQKALIVVYNNSLMETKEETIREWALGIH